MMGTFCFFVGGCKSEDVLSPMVVLPLLQNLISSSWADDDAGKEEEEDDEEEEENEEEEEEEPAELAGNI